VGNDISLQGSVIRIRRLSNADEACYLDAFCDEVRMALHVSDLQQEQIYFRERIEQQKNEKTFFYGIFDLATNELCGALEFRDSQTHRGQLYCWLNPSWRGRGFLQEALYLAMYDYSQQTGHAYITALVDENNKRSYWALKKAGFADIGWVYGSHGKQYELILRNKKIYNG
jgi:RimJ/RimL family protein N-acetyltransferase